MCIRDRSGCYHVSIVPEVEFESNIHCQGHYVVFAPPGEQTLTLGCITSIIILQSPTECLRRCLLQVDVHGAISPAADNTICAHAPRTLESEGHVVLVDIAIATLLRAVPSRDDPTKLLSLIHISEPTRPY
eukprot:TRINITY_DN19539_c0_g1_i1.p1 TRINITY_DN19539_c0_g1~~TRINITY_DN19539_c0_g1_i1.p1  ORF type:complete len:131 (+),score=21.76 TRINITY_DN19539_c0_g1_i1:119-511(+)